MQRRLSQLKSPLSLITSKQSFNSISGIQAINYGGLLPSHISRGFAHDRQALFVCKECGKEYTKWQGQCHACQNWNSITEKEREIVPKTPRLFTSRSARLIKPLTLDEIQPNAHSRILLQGKEMNRVFGGGVVPGSLVLIGGEPGIGKSTLLLRIASDICRHRSKQGVLYISGEESEDQVKLRCDRLGVRDGNLFLVHETDLDSIIQLVYQNVRLFQILSSSTSSLFVLILRKMLILRSSSTPSKLSMSKTVLLQLAVLPKFVFVPLVCKSSPSHSTSLSSSQVMSQRQAILRVLVHLNIWSIPCYIWREIQSRIHVFCVV